MLLLFDELDSLPSTSMRNYAYKLEVNTGVHSDDSNVDAWHSSVITYAGTSRNLEDMGGSHLLREEEEWVSEIPAIYGAGQKRYTPVSESGIEVMCV
ncbi:uncharacterized protein EKO05_0004624 [Ascochyta rabiei]|uniref:uncharacterized protein n=1 Tax=Didymella rabiei TaxID=5454 RepID=UPI00220124C8|nr:uncharacterized protein EKO05_0004624 [Ascochyta rabiei]UPX14133.1 hypothetical protein EKO05_0004624 [Ascochyta rabiei]